jgi:hypothetical protein
VTVLAVAGFYVYAALRRVPLATDALTASIALLAVVGPDTLTLDAVTSPQPMPLLVASLVQLGLGFWQRQGWRYLFGTVAATAVAALFIGVPEGCELGLLALLIGGASFRGVFGRLFQSIGAVLILGYCLGVMFAGIVPLESVSIGRVEFFPLVLAVLLAGYGLMLSHSWSQGAAAAIVVCWLGSLGWLGYGLLRQMIAGLDYLALSLMVFALAVLTSVAKTRVLSRLTPTRERA